VNRLLIVLLNCLVSCFLLTDETKVAQEPPLPKQPVSVTIIGGGISGLVCALECSKMGYDVVICDDPQKNWREIEHPVSTWPGGPQESWKDLLQTSKIESNENVSVYKTKVTQVTKVQKLFQITSEKGSFSSHALVVATGQEPKNMPLFAKNRFLPRPWVTSAIKPSETVIIITDNDAYALPLVRLALGVKKVYCLTRNVKPFARTPLEKLAKTMPNIENVLYDRLDTINSTQDTVRLEYTRQGSKRQIDASWVVLDTIWTPNSKIVSKIAPVDSLGAIITERETGQTSTAGLFSCGEVAHRQPISGIQAAAEGGLAARAVCTYLLEQGLLPKKEPFLLKIEEEAKPKSQ